MIAGLFASGQDAFVIGQLLLVKSQSGIWSAPTSLRPWYAAGMAKSRKRRVISRAVILLAVVVLLMCGYVSSYFAAHWAVMHGYRSLSPSKLRVFRPIEWYVWNNDHPGQVELRAIYFWSGNPEADSLANYYRGELQGDRYEREHPYED